MLRIWYLWNSSFFFKIYISIQIMYYLGFPFNLAISSCTYVFSNSLELQKMYWASAKLPKPYFCRRLSFVVSDRISHSINETNHRKNIVNLILSMLCRLVPLRLVSTDHLSILLQLFFLTHESRVVSLPQISFCQRSLKGFCQRPLKGFAERAMSICQ